MTARVPSEDDEQAAVVEYCDLKGYPRFRVPNETFTKSWSQKVKNKKLGVSAGVPDLFVIVGGRLIAIEMKRTKGSTTSAEQRIWIARLNSVGTPAKICKGADEAIQYINSFATGKLIPPPMFPKHAGREAELKPRKIPKKFKPIDDSIF